MTELYDSEGNAVEAFSSEEVEEKVAEATESVKQEVEEINSEQEQKIAELEETLGKEQEKEKNFAALRAKKEGDEPVEGQKETQATIESLQEQIEEAKNAGVSRVVELQRSSVFKELADGDPDLEEKIAANYELINKPEGTVDEIAERARDAYIMSMEIGHEDLIDGPITPPEGPGSPVGGGGGASGVSSEVKDLGRQFGLSDADWDKYNK